MSNLEKFAFGLVISAAGLWVNTATACDFCSPTVTMTPLRAKCFDAQVDDLLQQANATSAGFVIVDLESCIIDRTGRVVMRGVQAGLSRPPESELSEAERTVVLDQVTLECMRNLIDRHRHDLSPEKIFQISRVCK